MVFQPRLDAFRGICISLVFLTHTGYLDCGWIGVQAFFVLSGYLITGILLDSQGQGLDARTHFRNFYVRRALRIFPVYFAYLGATLLLAALAGEPWRSQVPASFMLHAPWLLTYTVNFFRIISPVNIALYAHLWSLSIEEQFYLLWPLLLFLTPSRWHVRLCLGIVVAGPLMRLAELAWQLHIDPHAVRSAGKFIYFFTASHLDAFAIGALLNFREGSAAVRDIVRLATKWALPTFVAMSAVMLFLARLAGYPISLNSLGWPTYLPYYYAYIWGFTLLNLVFFVAIANIDSLKAVMDLPPVRRLGKISYGFYIFHYPVLWLVRLKTGAHLGGTDWLSIGAVVAAFAITWAISELSFRCLETPLLRLKDRFRSTVVEPVPEPVADGA
ncbi:MAG TPA: acyltransferase [Xanthomonadaceae bacterium]|jgi:peptidoglycan/LPS O-acetylase OafA/YrhL